jgi:hypothetical protein
MRLSLSPGVGDATMHVWIGAEPLREGDFAEDDGE